MRYALISDVHANLPALEAVLADIDGRSDVDAIYHLGDLVGYAPWPNETVGLLHERSIAGVAGNYESTVGSDYKNCGCRYEDPRQEELSHLSYEWTRAHVSAETKRTLAGLPFSIAVRPWGGHTTGKPCLTLVHAHTTNNLIYVESTRPDAFLAKLGDEAGLARGDVIAFGHTHVPFHREVDGRHFVNVGSVGRPKDGDWRACYVLVGFSLVGVQVEFIRVEYDIERATEAIVDSTLPDDFAEYLRTGGKPALRL
jgi:predicted phosphodiesterase